MKCEENQSWQHGNQWQEQLRVARKDNCHTRIPDTSRREYSLHNELVQNVVPNAHRHHDEKKPSPGCQWVIRSLHDRQSVIAIARRNVVKHMLNCSVPGAGGCVIGGNDFAESVNKATAA